MIVVSLLITAMQTDKTMAIDYFYVFLYVELALTIIFTLEYGLRLWSATENKSNSKRWDFVTSPHSIIDLLVLFSFYISMVLSFDARILVLMRLFRLLKLFRYLAPLAIMTSVLRAEARAFLSAILVMTVLIYISATCIYYFEHSAQPEVFSSIPSAMWWSVVTLTTLGYGDIIPITVGGKFFAGCMTIFAIGIVSLPAGMLAARFSEELHKRKTIYRSQASLFMQNGSISQQQRDILLQTKQQLCLTESDIQHIYKQNSMTDKESQACPRCGYQH